VEVEVQQGQIHQEIPEEMVVVEMELLIHQLLLRQEQLILEVGVEVEMELEDHTQLGAGGKGVVILSMPLANFSGTTTGSPTESDDGTTKVLIFNGRRELHSIMASFAKIGLNGKVIEVLSVVNEVLHDS
jgi:hypothetical protein